LLVPVDYSPSSLASLKYAAFLASALGAELDVVHVWDRPSYVSDDVVVQDREGRRGSLSQMVHDNAEREMTQFLEKSRAATGKASVQAQQHRLLSGEPVSALLAEVEKGSHDLVVIGTHGRTGLKHLLLGSVAERLVRLSPVPVVTVPPLAPDSTLGPRDGA
jgi:nucleotide-binding universal stress UspA family protein